MSLTSTWSTQDAPTTQCRARIVREEYSQLRQLAARRMSGERDNHMLTGTALANEVAMKFLTDPSLPTKDRARFFAYATVAMRNHLVDHARAAGRKKRGGDRVRQSCEHAESAAAREREELDELTEALNLLERLDPRRARVVRMRFFDGRSNDDIAAQLGVSVATVKRDWEGARNWLQNRMRAVTE